MFNHHLHWLQSVDIDCCWIAVSVDQRVGSSRMLVIVCRLIAIIRFRWIDDWRELRFTIQMGDDCGGAAANSCDRMDAQLNRMLSGALAIDNHFSFFNRCPISKSGLNNHIQFEYNWCDLFWSRLNAIIFTILNLCLRLHCKRYPGLLCLCNAEWNQLWQFITWPLANKKETFATCAQNWWFIGIGQLLSGTGAHKIQFKCNKIINVCV